MAIAALSFTTREKDYGGIHLGVAAGDVAPLCAMLASIAAAPLDRRRQLALGGDVATLAGQVFPRGRFVALTSIQLQRADRVHIAIAGGAGVVQLTAAAAHRARERVAMAHQAGGDSCLAGDSEAWTDRLWIWPL